MAGMKQYVPIKDGNKELTTEYWRPYRDGYEFSNEGRCRHMVYGKYFLVEGHIHKKTRILDAKKYGWSVSYRRALWETFYGKVPDGYYVASKIGDTSKSDSILTLELRKMRDVFKLDEPRNKKKVICLDNGVIYDSIKEASEKLYCVPLTIKNTCKGKIKKPSVNVMFLEDYEQKVRKDKKVARNVDR